jgi:mannose-6-phosphate isomerase-like protein (cupin superfamily)
MSTQAIDLKQKLALIEELWSPRIIAELNDIQFKVAKLHGEFVWHSHEDTDEAFLVVSGRLRIELRDGSVELGPGQLHVVPKGVEHRPIAEEECHLLLIEPRGVVNTGASGGELTAEQDRWI